MLSHVSYILKTGTLKLTQNFEIECGYHQNNTKTYCIIKIIPEILNSQIISIGDILTLDLVVNNIHEQIFDGTIIFIDKSIGEIHTSFEFFDKEKIQETFQNTSYQEAIRYLAKREVRFLLEDFTPDQLILNGFKEEVFNDLIISYEQDLGKKIIYFIDKNKTLWISDSLATVKNSFLHIEDGISTRYFDEATCAALLGIEIGCQVSFPNELSIYIIKSFIHHKERITLFLES